MTIIAQPHIESTRGRQLAAARALGHILDHKLPTATWGISGNTVALDGQINRTADKATRVAIDDFANFLRADVTEARHLLGDDDWICLTVQATYRGVPVKVWGTVGHSSATTESSVNS